MNLNHISPADVVVVDLMNRLKKLPKKNAYTNLKEKVFRIRLIKINNYHLIYV